MVIIQIINLGLLNLKKSSKWIAWESNKGMTKDEAKKSYISIKEIKINII